MNVVRYVYFIVMLKYSVIAKYEKLLPGDIFGLAEERENPETCNFLVDPLKLVSCRQARDN